MFSEVVVRRAGSGENTNRGLNGASNPEITGTAVGQVQQLEGSTLK